MATRKLSLPANAGRLSPQQALIMKNEQVGNNHIKNMQGTSRTLWHFLPLDGTKQFNFFQQLNKVAFPFTNIDQNKLSAGETMSLQRASLVYMVLDGSGNVTSLTSAEDAGLRWVFGGKYNFFTANQNIVKDLFTGIFLSPLNKASKFYSQNVYHFDTMATLLENVEFYATIQTTGYTPVANAYLGLVIEGVGSILNLKQTA